MNKLIITDECKKIDKERIEQLIEAGKNGSWRTPVDKDELLRRLVVFFEEHKRREVGNVI